MIIRNHEAVMGNAQPRQFDTSTPVKRSKKRTGIFHTLSLSSIASYMGVFLLIVSVVAISYQPPKREASVVTPNGPTAGVSQAAASVSPTASVDSLMATTVGATIADSTGLPVANNVANLSQSLATESMLAQTDTNVISKPQIVQPTANAKSVQEYTTVAGDTVPLIGQKYGISAQTIKWANGLTSDAVEPGRKLTILPVDGILYTIRPGDTIDSIAARYGANRQDIVTINDLELSGEPTAGQRLTIPNGNLPENERPGYQAPTTTRRNPVANGLTGSYSGGYATTSNLTASVGNKYAFGNCTWYVYERRAQLGMPVGSFWGNATTWAMNAAAAGFLVDGNPTVGSIMQNGGGYGHVAVIEAVNPGVSVSVSEMNGYRFGGGFNRIGRGEIPWSEVMSGMYRYIH